MRRAYYSKWKEAAEGLQRRIMGMHQVKYCIGNIYTVFLILYKRTQWKFRSVRKNGAAVLLEMTDEDKSFGTIQVWYFDLDHQGKHLIIDSIGSFLENSSRMRLRSMN